MKAETNEKASVLVLSGNGARIIGSVYFGSHSVWVAQLEGSSLSASFISRDRAIGALIERDDLTSLEAIRIH